MFQVRTVLQQQFSDIGVTIFARIRQCSIASSRLGVDVGAGFQQITDLLVKKNINREMFNIISMYEYTNQIEMALLGSFH